MYYYIKGYLTVSAPSLAVVEAGGVGYKLTISDTTYRSLPHASMTSPQTVLLYTQVITREDGTELYGFANERESNAFTMLISVSGVGPKAAMSILSMMSPEKFALAVCTDNKKALSAAPGVGAKTAARIILELRDKLMKESAISDKDISAAMTDHRELEAGAPSGGKLNEARDALVVLGYTRQEAAEALKSIDTVSLSLEDIIKVALKKLMKG